MIEDLQDRLQAEFQVDSQPLPERLQRALDKLAAAEKNAKAADRAIPTPRLPSRHGVFVLIDGYEAKRASLPLRETAPLAPSARAQLFD